MFHFELRKNHEDRIIKLAMFCLCYSLKRRDLNDLRWFSFMYQTTVKSSYSVPLILRPVLYKDHFLSVLRVVLLAEFHSISI